MESNKTILLIGACGCGKTWVMKNLIKEYSVTKKCKIGKMVFQLSDNIAIMGNYDGSIFEGSDKLSMAVMSDVKLLKGVQDKHNLKIICEGDRFTNSTFIKAFNPLIIKILDNGNEGRALRNSNQTERHIKAISTRVSNIKENIRVNNSQEALTAIKNLINEKN